MAQSAVGRRFLIDCSISKSLESQFGPKKHQQTSIPPFTSPMSDNLVAAMDVQSVPISDRNKILTAILEVVPNMVIRKLEQVIIYPDGALKPYSVRLLRPFYPNGTKTVYMDLEQATLDETMNTVIARRRVRLNYNVAPFLGPLRPVSEAHANGLRP